MAIGTMSKIILYGTKISVPCRSVWLTAEAIGIELECREMNLIAGDNMKKDFLKLNPQHTVPTIDDSGFILWDSHAIVCYLVTKYGKNDALYPKDPRTRAIIDQRLHFDSGVLFANLKTVCKSIFFSNRNTITDEHIALLKEPLEFMNAFLDGREWLVGDHYTVADICCYNTTVSFKFFICFDNYPNVKTWIKRCEQQLPGYAKWSKPGEDQMVLALRSRLAHCERYPLK